MNTYSFRSYFRFFRDAVTRYQIHSPFAYGFVSAVLEDKRWFYAFEAVEMLRRQMLESVLSLDIVDYGKTPPTHYQRNLSDIVRRAGSSARQGKMLFRMVEYYKPAGILELGTSAGIGAMYMRAAARNAHMITLEGSSALAAVARTNLEVLQLQENCSVMEGPFQQTLPIALQQLKRQDMVFFDGHHEKTATLAYFEACLAHAHPKTVFVFDDVYWSEDMHQAWEQIKNHPAVTLSIDFFDLSVVFIQPDFKEKIHLKVVPARWKIWKFY